MNHKKELKKIINEELDPVLAEFGFKRVVTGWNVVYYFERNGIGAEVFYHIKDALTFGMTKVHMHLPEIENIILEIGLPNFDLEDYKKGKEKLYTIYDGNAPLYNFPTEPITDEKYTEQIVWEVKQYMQQYGMPFIEHYSYLPNVLKEMDRLESENIVWADGILTGGPEYMFRGLIISKLCRDPAFEKKINKIDSIYEEHNLTRWQPYYDKLKGVLATLEPKYPYYQ